MSGYISDCVNVQRIYVSQWLHTVVWAYVSAQRRIGITPHDALTDFREFFALDDVDMRALKKIYERKSREYHSVASGIRADLTNAVKEEHDADTQRRREQMRDLTLFMNQKLNEIDP